MIKTISFELSKRLNELGLLDNLETEYKYCGEYTEWAEDINTDPEATECDYQTFSINEGELLINKNRCKKTIKTLTLEEAIEFLPKFINNGEGLAPLNYNFYYNILQYIGPKYMYYTCTGDTLLESVEEMITYLLDNNLLGN